MVKAVLFSSMALAIGAVSAHSQDDSGLSSLQQMLNSRFALTAIAPDRSGLVTPGTTLVLLRDNLMMYSSACPSSPETTYKNGKLSQGFGRNFARDLGGSMAMPGNATTANCPKQLFAKGTQVWVTGIDIKKDAVVFKLFITPNDRPPYYGDLRFPAGKGTLLPPDEMLKTISEVFAVPPTPSPAQAPVALAPTRLGSVYVNSQNAADRLQLSASGSFTLQEGGQSFSGTYSVAGSSLKLRIDQLQKEVEIAVQADRLIVNGEEVWMPPAQ